MEKLLFNPQRTAMEPTIFAEDFVCKIAKKALICLGIYFFPAVENQSLQLYSTFINALTGKSFKLP